MFVSPAQNTSVGIGSNGTMSYQTNDGTATADDSKEPSRKLDLQDFGTPSSVTPYRLFSAPSPPARASILL
ncbi:unnamed protein product [Arabis nemorensis]|uniref:Uncharacterized protein n=1 Tax=Arabis nemorensis TaxID=586526 RepID=A0A565ASN3_9BRAS|nr:unnamed protein product [Arabis nemorensis]